MAGDRVGGAAGLVLGLRFERSGLNDRAGDEATGSRPGDQCGHERAPGGLAHQRDPSGITPEGGDLGVHPFQGQGHVEDADVARRALEHAEPFGAQSVVRRYEDDPIAGERGAVVDGLS